MTAPLRVGIVGCGEVAEHKHLRALRQVPEVAVVALADVLPERLRHVGERYGIPHLHSSAAALIADPEVEAVAVCTPASAHRDPALEALAACKPVLLEKPLALNIEDGRALIQAAHRAAVPCVLGFHMRFHRLVRQAREWIREGRLGSIESIHSVWNSPRPDRNIVPWKTRRATGGGSLIEIGVHHFDLWRDLLGAEVESVYATARHGIREDENAAVLACLSNGLTATGSFSERAPHEIRIEICGSAARLRIDCLCFDGLALFPAGTAPGDPGLRLDALRRLLRELPEGLRGRNRGGDYIGSYTAAWRHFVRCVRTGEKPRPALEDGLQALGVSLAAARSASEGRVVPLREVIGEGSPEGY